MTVTIEVLAWLRPKLGYPEGSKALIIREVAADETVGSLFAQLAAELPGFGEHVYAVDEDRILEHVAVLLNGRAVEIVGGTRAYLADGDRLILLPGFAGG
jgi:molybdopterin converting factor small subunit